MVIANVYQYLLILYLLDIHICLCTTSDFRDMNCSGEKSYDLELPPDSNILWPSSHLNTSYPQSSEQITVSLPEVVFHHQQWQNYATPVIKIRFRIILKIHELESACQFVPDMWQKTPQHRPHSFHSQSFTKTPSAEVMEESQFSMTQAPSNAMMCPPSCSRDLCKASFRVMEDKLLAIGEMAPKRWNLHIINLP